MLEKKDLMFAPVQKNPCKTCPFIWREGRTGLSTEKYKHYVENLQAGNHHFCHSADNNMICRGGRIIQLKIFTAFGWISEPTDEALQFSYRKYLGKWRIVLFLIFYIFEKVKD